MKNLSILFLGYFMAAYLALFVSFSTVVWFESAHHDNTRYFRKNNSDNYEYKCANDSQYEWLHIIGRPITAKIECKVFKHTRQLADLAKMRVVVIGTIAAASAILGLILVRFGLDKVTSLLISIAIFTLPGMQNAAFMTNFPNALSPLIALFSFLVFDSLQPFCPWQWKRPEIIRFLFSFALLACTALIYPALAFVFFWGTLARALTNPHKVLQWQTRLLVSDFAIFGGAMLSGLLGGKAFVPKNLKLHPPAIPDQFQIDLSFSGLIEKLPFLFTKAIPSAANLWFMQKEFLGSMLISLIVLSAIALMIYPKRRPNYPCFNPVIMVFVFLLFIITLVPLMLAKIPSLHQRLLFPGMGAITLMSLLLIPSAINRVFLSPINKKNLAIKSVACAFAGIGIIFATYTQAKNVWNTNVEMMFVRTELAKYKSPPRRIHLIRAIDNQTGFNGLQSFSDEFNRKTTDYEQDIVAFIRLSLFGSSPSSGMPVTYCDPQSINCETAVPKSHLIVSYSDYGQPFCKTNDMAVVDLNILVRATGTGHPNIAETGLAPFCKNQ